MPLGYTVKSMSYGGVNLLESVLKVTEGMKEEIQVGLERTPGVTVSGRVTGVSPGESLNQMWVVLQSPTQPSPSGIVEQRVSEIVPEADGTFIFQNIPPGTYTLRSLPTPTAAQTVTVPPDGVRDLEVKVLPLPQPNTPLLAANLPPRSIDIAGKVIMVPGVPMPQKVRLRVYALRHPPTGGFDAPVNADGSFRFQGVPAGEFDLNPDLSPASGRNFTSSESITSIELKIPATLRGRVVMADGGTLPSSILITNTYSAGELGGARSSPATRRTYALNAGGSFSMDVVRGDQLISVAGLPAGISVKSMTYGSADIRSTLSVIAPINSEMVITLSRD